jgi:hypothetical protein
MAIEESAAMDAAMRGVEGRAEAERVWAAAREFFHTQADEERRRLTEFFLQQLDAATQGEGE